MDNLKKYIDNGVIFEDEKSVFIDDSVSIGSGTVVAPNVRIKGNSSIGKNVHIGFCTEITDSIVEDNVSIKQSVICESLVGEGSTVGPFAYLRPGSRIGKKVKVGDFVEIKNSNIGDETKISHLTYVGDADVGKRVNFGCGTVVVNYDGRKKHRTVIEDDAFVGCNTNLVSPVKVGERAYTAAGSTITEDIPSNALAIARVRQTVKENWVSRRK